MSRTLLAMGMALGLAACAPAPEAQPATAPAVVTPQAAPELARPVSDEPMAWIEGAWCGGEEGERIEETWFAPTSNEAIGMSRTLRGGRMVSFEYMRIMDIEGKLTFIGQPSGEPPTSFVRSAGGAGWIRFENRQHDYPQRIEYRRVGEELHAEIGGPGAGGKEEVISFVYRRCGK